MRGRNHSLLKGEHSMKRNHSTIFLFLLCLFGLAIAQPVYAQNHRPDLVWMRGGQWGQGPGGIQTTDVQVSPDGSLFASCGVGTVKIWRISDGMLLRTINNNA